MIFIRSIPFCCSDHLLFPYHVCEGAFGCTPNPTEVGFESFPKDFPFCKVSQFTRFVLGILLNLGTQLFDAVSRYVSIPLGICPMPGI
jgi:hypothetical protein